MIGAALSAGVAFGAVFLILKDEGDVFSINNEGVALGDDAAAVIAEDDTSKADN